MIIKSDRIYTDKGIVDGYLEIKGSKIINILESYDGEVTKDFTGYRILPGLIDTHNHGAFGYMFDTSNKEELKRLLKSYASQGLTGIFATTDKADQYPILAELSREEINGTKILGIHSEGPWGSRSGENSKGASYPEVDMDYAKELYEKANGLLKVFDIAPEVKGSDDLIKYFTEKGVVVSAFHTNANFEEMNEAFDKGISNVIHLYNVMTGIHHRKPGAVSASILREDVTCELICDGLHVSLPVIELTLRMKDNSKIIMISDNVLYASLPQGKYKGFTDDENNDRSIIEVTKEGFVLSKTGRLSGSSFPVIYGIKNLVEKLHHPLEEVVKLASLNPARKYGLTNKGEIKEANDADFIIVDSDLEVINTYVEGMCVFDKNADKIYINEDF